MERSWFAGKRCLDVGCNEGLVSLAVASRFGAAAMLGLDIDASLVQRACANLCRCAWCPATLTTSALVTD